MERKTYKSSTIRGKLRVCRYLAESTRLRNLVPHTVSFTLSSLRKMTEAYSSLYIKPDIGSLGIGIYKLNRLEEGFELLGTRSRHTTSKRFATVEEVYRHLKKTAKERLIVQATVKLDTIDERPYDVRVMVQRKPKGKWTCTGAFAKVGKAERIVTNYFQGGQIITLPDLWSRKGLEDEQASLQTKDLEAKALAVTRLLSSKRKGMHEMGIDFAYDCNGELWVLEVNSNHPQYHPIRKLDPDAYSRMKSFAASYGRYSGK